MDPGLAHVAASAHAKHLFVAPADRRHHRLSRHAADRLDRAAGDDCDRPRPVAQEWRPIMKSLLAYGLVALSVVIPQLAEAQQAGDAQAGFAYADGVCSECHAVKKGERVSPHERAPAFEVV